MSTAGRRTPVTVVVWGDSIAASGWPQLLEFAFNVCSNTGTPIRVVNSGRGGNPAARARHEFLQSVLIHRPHVVFIQFGFNDQRFDGSRGARPISTPAEFARHLAEMIRLCREEAGAEVIVLGNHRTLVTMNLPSGLGYDDAAAVYRQRASAVAAAAGVRFVDMSAALAHPDIPYTRLLADDGVHLSEMGKTHYARLAANELQRLPLRALAARHETRPSTLESIEASALLPPAGPISRVRYPAARGVRFEPLPRDATLGFEDIRSRYGNQPRDGLLFARGTFSARKDGLCRLVVGADGPFKVFLNGRPLGGDPDADNPISAHLISLRAHCRKGTNEVLVALRTNGGKAWGFMAMVSGAGC